MKFFVDTANLEEIREAADLGLLDGVTTNPSLIAKEGDVDFETRIREICEIVDGDVSAEVTAVDYEGMLEQGRKLAEIADNVVIKCPLTWDGLKATKTFSEEGTKVNVTLCFSPSQALLAAKAGAGYISPFIGRLDDISQDGMELIRQIVEIYDNYGFETEILAASIRHPVHIVDSALAGADVATVPFSVFKKIVKHPLTDKGLDAFLSDWKASGRE
ncbi:MAG: fructose-6-phosphate aldolase [Acidobacteria bacterium]|nr:MAG: fructose-6-phosphate aldolase [Acidobacteriota bacterium]REK01414.1 MAG: fructose-6-phosphate aldolase [Acidobacteriota bacterium]REK14370.1 MAG: fructose-6-phosphate aldolase [Acidobacteriota bacterium]REK45085.1 MAG: fructose-6-phosphate aldolase [Acidobacteriota bacterium]